MASLLLLTGCDCFTDNGKKGNESIEAGDIDDSSIVETQSKSPDKNKFPQESENTSEPETQTPDDDELVLIKNYIPDAVLDIRYATENNFTGEIIYDSSDAYLRYGTVKKLVAVQEELKNRGFGLLIWDAYRPTAAQWKLWEVCPDPNFVSDPNKNFSGHSKGNTVDITLVGSDGFPVEMPSGFDEFGPLADRNYSDVSEVAAKNAKLLEEIMLKHGFIGYDKEWWHFSDTVKYEVVQKNDKSSFY